MSLTQRLRKIAIFGQTLNRHKEIGTMAIDPVCKMQVDEKKAAVTYEYKGRTYYFCAVGCKEKFAKEPEKYVEAEK